MKTKFTLFNMRLLIVVAFVCCSLFQSNAQWKTVRVGGGGAVTSIQAHPKVQNLYFITTDVGTPYRWNSSTQAWEGLFYNLPASYWGRQASGNLAFDPSDASGNVLYATTGATWGNGDVLKSVDRGTTWTDCKVTIDVKPNSDQSYGQRLAVDPNNSNVVYVTTRPSTTGVTAINGTFKSIDAGLTWTKINDLCGAFLLFDSSGGMTTGVTKNIFIGCADGVYQSTNGGTVFTLMNGSPANSYRADIHTNGTMYITHFKSVEKWNGTTWSSVTPPSVYQFSPVAVNPNNSEEVIVGNNDYSAYKFDQYVSNNGGTSWTKISPASVMTEVPWNTGSIGQGLKDFCWDPFDQNMVWFTDFLCPFQTTNIWAGTTVSWKARATGEEETCATGNLLCPPSGSNLLLSNVADCGGWDHKSLTTAPSVGLNTLFPWSWTGDAGNMTGAAIQETNPDFIARVGRHGWNGAGYAGHSTDGGATYKIWTCPPNATGGRIAVSANSTTMIWVTQSGPCFRSTDLGTTWNQVFSLPVNIITQADVFSCGSVFPIAADKVNGNKFYVYFGGKMYVSIDGGATFTSAGSLPNPYITNPLAVETTPGKEGDVWTAMNSSGLYHSTNSGTSFTQIANVQIANSVSIGKASPGTPNNPAIYVYGTVNNITNGLFRSNDNGATWQTVSAPLHTGMEVYTMAADRQVYGRVFFATSGNGTMYVEDIADAQAPTPPTDLIASSTDNTSTRLTWGPSSDNVYVASYNIYKDGILLGNSTLYSYSVTGLSAGTTYAFSVKAKDLSGNLSEASVVNVLTPTVYVAPENIALGKRSYANPFNPGALAANANDGNLVTFTSNLTGAVPWWYMVNLGNTYNLNGVEIYWKHPEWINKYKIEVSKDSIVWNMASDKTSNVFYGGTSEINNFTTNASKYIRMTVTGSNAVYFWPSLCEFKVFGTLSITGTNPLQASRVRVYPNPATDYINIETEKSNADVTVLTMNGMIVSRNKTTNSNFTIPVSNWRKGVYLVRITDEKGVAIEKVIVQ